MAGNGRPPTGSWPFHPVSHQSLLTDVANLTARNGRLRAYITRLERRLSEALGQAVWGASGLSAPPTSKDSPAKIGQLERSELAEREGDLAAARAANRDLMARLNS
ncbi:hypothetical protein [Streptomyces sp. NPDC048385]|uniref:hypothetical protein n=1 Tax=unclassified Streptomyces TaxID=2593676 RepID=UPI00343CD2FC